MCNATSPGDQGLCYTQTECSNMGGRVAGVCAQGFGVCCLCNEIPTYYLLDILELEYTFNVVFLSVEFKCPGSSER